jgi:hypothetical protein
MSRTIIGRYAMALALGLAFAGQIAPHAFAQSTSVAAASQEQVAKNPITAQDGNAVPFVSDQRNGAGEVIDQTYGIPLPGQEHYPD